MPDSRRASEDLLVPQAREQQGLIMSPISEISGGPVTFSELQTTEEMIETKTMQETDEVMKERSASLSLPVNAQPVIEILAKKKTNPQVTLSPTYNRLKQSPPRIKGANRVKNRPSVGVMKRRRRFEKAHGSVSLDIVDTDVHR